MVFDSLTLPLDGKKDTGVETTSINSTPASDTFYTATSVLSPDPQDLNSPLSPLPLDVPHSGNIRNNGNLNTGACGALDDKQNELVSEVPINDARKIDPPHSKCNDINVSAVQNRFIVEKGDNCDQKTIETDNSDMSHMDQNDFDASKASEIKPEAFGALLLSPIHTFEDSTHSQDYHTIQGKTASTPIEVESKCDFKKNDSLSVKSRRHAENKKTVSRSSSTRADISEPSQEIKRLLSYGSSDSPPTHPCNVDNEVSVSLNNNIFPDNGNTKEYPPDVAQVNRVSRYSSEDYDLQNSDMQASSEWYPGLNIKEKSELIPQEAEVEKATEVLIRLREKSEEASISINEQVCLYLFIKQQQCLKPQQICSHHNNFEFPIFVYVRFCFLMAIY